MFPSSQFDSAFAGGGFMSSQPSQAYDSSSSTTKSRDFQGLVPVTVKQISEASQSGDEKSNFVVNGVEVTNVTMVGIVFEKDDSKFTDVKFYVDDGTGRIECRRWVNEPYETREMEAVQDGMYVRINGHLKSFQNKRQLVGFSVKPVTDFNEVTFHYIECVHFFLENSNSKMIDSKPMGSSVHQTAPPANVSAPYSIDASKSLDDLVLDYLKQPSSTDRQQGVHMDEISQQLKISMEKLENCIHSLEADGMIYSTIDQFHYKHVEA